jgi:hypothetical protein
MSWQTCGSTVICGGFAALALAAGTATASAAMAAVRAARGLGEDKMCIGRSFVRDGRAAHRR